MEIYRKLLQLVDQQDALALLLVVGATGSTPQRVGAKALVDRSGSLLAGTIGGGLMESKALARAAQLLQHGRPELLEFSMDESYSRDAGPICGGAMRVFAAPCRADSGHAYESATVAVEARQKGLLVTTISGQETGCTRWFSADELGKSDSRFDRERLGTILKQGRPDIVVASMGGDELFVEPVAAPPRMLIVGAGHVGQAIAQQASWLGFDVTVLDDRTDFAQTERFPAGTNVLCGKIGEQVERFPKEEDTYIVLVSKGHKPDAEALEACIHSKSAYLGMIGSRRKVALLRKHFLESGLATEEEFGRVFAPIGLDIGAVTVEEIATSIMAQIVTVRRKGCDNKGINDMVLR